MAKIFVWINKKIMSRFLFVILIILIVEIGFIVLGFSFSYQKVYVREKNIPASVVSWKILRNSIK